MKKHIIQLTKKCGQLSFDKTIEFVCSLLSDGEYIITIERKKSPRSIQQNSLMWMWFKCISDETGHTTDEIHDIYCSKFLRKRIRVMNEEVVVVCGTSKLSTDEMSKFLELVRLHALEKIGIYLPLPEDEKFAVFKAMYQD